MNRGKDYGFEEDFEAYEDHTISGAGHGGEPASNIKKSKK